MNRSFAKLNCSGHANGTCEVFYQCERMLINLMSSFLLAFSHEAGSSVLIH